jgi:hypothetical protein
MLRQGNCPHPHPFHYPSHGPLFLPFTRFWECHSPRLIHPYHTMISFWSSGKKNRPITDHGVKPRLDEALDGEYASKIDGQAQHFVAEKARNRRRSISEELHSWILVTQPDAALRCEPIKLASEGLVGRERGKRTSGSKERAASGASRAADEAARQLWAGEASSGCGGDLVAVRGEQEAAERERARGERGERMGGHPAQRIPTPVLFAAEPMVNDYLSRPYSSRRRGRCSERDGRGSSGTRWERIDFPLPSSLHMGPRGLVPTRWPAEREVRGRATSPF